jgi:hypothetical protein
MLGAGLLLAAVDAHAPDSAREPTILVAAELVPETPRIALECAAVAARESVELRFERIATEPSPDEMRRLLTRGAQRTVVFEWNSDTGELTYGAAPEFTLPASRGAAASTRFRASCGSH